MVKNKYTKCPKIKYKIFNSMVSNTCLNNFCEKYFNFSYENSLY